MVREQHGHGGGAVNMGRRSLRHSRSRYLSASRRVWACRLAREWRGMDVSGDRRDERMSSSSCCGASWRNRFVWAFEYMAAWRPRSDAHRAKDEADTMFSGRRVL
jgi:hypothetical protein